MEVIDLIERVTTRLGPPKPGEESEFDYPIEAQIPSALEALARACAEMHSSLLTKTFEVNGFAAGSKDISSLSELPEPILVEYIDQAALRISGYSFPLRAAPDRAYLALDPSKVPTYAIEDDTLFVKGKDGKQGTFVGDVAINGAPYIPSLANVPRSLEGRLVEIVIGMLSKIPKPPRPRPDQTKAPASN